LGDTKDIKFPLLSLCIRFSTGTSERRKEEVKLVYLENVCKSRGGCAG